MSKWKKVALWKKILIGVVTVSYTHLRLAHARHVAVLVDHAGAARRADARADGVEHVNDAARDDERHAVSYTHLRRTCSASSRRASTTPCSWTST